jgi:hypothetical protein
MAWIFSSDLQVLVLLRLAVKSPPAVEIRRMVLNTLVFSGSADSADSSSEGWLRLYFWCRWMKVGGKAFKFGHEVELRRLNFVSRNTRPQVIEQN